MERLWETTMTHGIEMGRAGRRGTGLEEVRGLRAGEPAHFVFTGRERR
jgi:hypothetical protein